MDKTNHERRVIHSVFYANSVALILIILAWYSLFSLRDNLEAAIAAEQIERDVAAQQRKLGKDASREKIEGREVWMSAANELLIETSSQSWTTEDQLEYERLRMKLSPNLKTPDYRKPPSEREIPVSQSQDSTQ